MSDRSELPPYRTDPQGPLTPEFLARRAAHSERMARLHPEWFCELHHRCLGQKEIEMGGCFWCRPERVLAYERKHPKAAKGKGA